MLKLDDFNSRDPLQKSASTGRAKLSKERNVLRVHTTTGSQTKTVFLFRLRSCCENSDAISMISHPERWFAYGLPRQKLFCFIVAIAERLTCKALLSTRDSISRKPNPHDNLPKPEVHITLSRIEVCVLPFYAPINWKLQHPPPGIPRAFDCVSCPRRREFERCVGRVGNLNRIYLLF